ATREKLDQLLKLTERYCVVYQTIKSGRRSTYGSAGCEDVARRRSLGRDGRLALALSRAHSSAGERSLHTREVPGSIPGAPIPFAAVLSLRERYEAADAVSSA